MHVQNPDWTTLNFVFNFFVFFQSYCQLHLWCFPFQLCDVLFFTFVISEMERSDMRFWLLMIVHVKVPVSITTDYTNLYLLSVLSFNLAIYQVYTRYTYIHKSSVCYIHIMHPYSTTPCKVFSEQWIGSKKCTASQETISVARTNGSPTYCTQCTFAW